MIPAIRRYITDNDGYSVHFIDNIDGYNFTFDIKEQRNELENKKNEIIKSIKY